MKPFAILILAASTLAGGQTITVKSSPAEDALVQAAKDLSAEQQTVNTARQQAINSLNASQKDLQQQLQATQKELTDKLKADKHYAPLMDKIDTLQKQLQEAGAQAQQEFNQKAGPIRSKMNTDSALIIGLIPVVRKENGLPDTAIFDPVTQTWKNPAAKK